MGNSIYDYGLDSSASDLENFISLMGAEETTTSPFSLILNILGYVLLSIGLYTIAKRRGIKNPWMAWIPIASTWLLGCISDQYHYITRREEKSRRKAMLTLEILMVAVCIVMIAIVIMMIPDLILFIEDNMTTTDFEHIVNNGTVAHIMQMTGWIGIAALVTLGLGIALSILTFMSYYDLFASCDPNNKTLYLVLGILFNILMSIFVFVCRKKDYGMPPRRDEVPSQPAMWTPPQQTWQPPQPPVEPWEQNRE